MQTALAAWNERFAIPGAVELAAGQGALPKIVITLPSATAEIYLHGAQVTSWRPSGAEEVLFLSQRSRFEDGKAIRGGIPICFPWFRAKADNPQAPAHGFVRTRAWQLEAITHQADTATVTLSTTSDEASRKWWPHQVHVLYRVTVAAQLRLELTVANTGNTAFRFEEALHTYHRVGHAPSIHIAGLDGVSYLDNMDGNRTKIQQGDVTLAGQTDNAYLATAAAVELVDPVLHRRIRTEKQNSATTVVWNPWKEGAASLADLGDDEWQTMACAEASNILDAAIRLAPGEQHIMTATLRVIT